MNYRLVYDVTTRPPELWFAGMGLLFVGIGVLLWRFRHRLTGSSVRRTVFPALFLGFAVMWTTVASVSVIGGHVSATRALRDGTAQVVEGTVEDFHPMPASGHDTERFTVKGVRFEYSDFIVTAGFNNTSSHGGPMRPGLPVRIHYVGDKRPVILKLEVAE